MKRSCGYLWIICCGILSWACLNPPPVYATGDRSPESDSVAAPGWPLGPFVLLPELSLGGGYDSNIYATPDAEESDRLLILRPTLAIKSTGPDHRIRLNAGLQVTRFDKNSSEDSEDSWLNLNARYKLGTNGNIFGGFALSKEHEERGSSDDVDGREPTTYFSSGLHLGTEIDAQTFALRLGGTLQDLDFDDVPTLTTSINNDDRDRSLYGFGLRASYKLNATYAPFVQLIYDQRNYVKARDDNNFMRDSQGYRAVLGLKAEQAKFTSKIFIGTLWQEYDDSRFKTVRDLDLGASVSWKPQPGTKIVLELEREVNETTLPDASGYLETAGQLRLIQKLTEPLSFSGLVRLARDDFQGISRKDDILDVRFGLRYDLFRHLFLAADYRFLQQESKSSASASFDNNEYDRQQIFLTLGAKI